MSTHEFRESIRQDLLNYVVSQRFSDVATEINGQTQLLKEGIIDSLSMMSFILYLENKYQLDFLKIDITREQFVNVDSLADFVAEALAQ